MFADHTPIERYRVVQRPVFVKRDDLYASPPCPPLGKLRGARVLLKKLFADGVRLVGCWDTRISALGQGVAACCRELPGMKALVSYPALKGGLVPEPLLIARRLGAEILPVRAGRITISFAESRQIVESRGGVMLPFGLECSEAVKAVTSEAARVPKKFTEGGSVLVCSGSGVTLAGLVLGLRGHPSAFHAISSGRSPANILRCVARYGAPTKHIIVHPASVPYNEAIQWYCPFPSHPHYDLKAWRFLVENIKQMTKPIFFWNIGA
jgi:hypothetical protein